MKSSSRLKAIDAIRVIKEHHCKKCGSQAKGFIFRKTLPIYYCRKCLHQELDVND